jgi:hypothetical protein
MPEVSGQTRAGTRWRRAVGFGLLIGTVLAIGVHLPGWWQTRSDAAVVSPAVAPSSELHAQLLSKLIGAERAKVGCPALRPNAVLNAIASSRAGSISVDSAGAVGHIDADLRNPQDRASAFGYRARVVENLAVGLGTADDVMALWLNPGGDRALKARLDDCTFVSVGLGFSTRQLTKRYGPGVWVAVLGAG